MSNQQTRFDKHPVMTIAVILLLIWLAAELLIFMTVKPETTLAFKTENSRLSEDFEQEIITLHFEDTVYHPYRWYSLPAGHRTENIVLDHSGFRNDWTVLSEDTQKIVFFGGSTMFSTATREDGAIPAILNNDYLQTEKVQALNFGLGGYSSSTELVTMIEVLRLYKNIKYAVFYDGVNEVGRYIERLQDHADAPFYDVMGYPALNFLQAAIGKQYLGGRYEDYKNSHMLRFPYTLSLLRHLLAQAPEDEKLLPRTEADEFYKNAAETIADIYVRNLRDIDTLARAHNVVPVFVLQPHIFSTENRTAAEESIYQGSIKYTIDIEKLHHLAYDAIRARTREAGIRIYDLSNVLNEKPEGEHVFHDYCHLYANGNEILARHIMAILKPQIPAGWIK